MKMSKNILFPGRPNYTGPKTGYFGLLHHDTLYEYSHDIDERLDYVRTQKPKHEIAVRLYNMIYLGDLGIKRKPIDDDYRAKRKLIYDDYYAKLKPIYDDYRAKRKLIDDDYRAKLKLIDDDYHAKRKPIDDDYDAKLKLIDDDYYAKRKPIDDDYRAKFKPIDDEILAYIKKHIPDTAWNGKELVFK